MTSHDFLAALTSDLVTASFNPALPWGNCGTAGSQLLALPAPRLGACCVSLPIPRKNNELDKFLPDGHPGSTEICFSLSKCIFFSPLELPLSGEQWVYCLWGENTGFLTRRRVPFSDMLY